MASGPDVGDDAPDFTLPSTQGEITLSEYARDGAVLLVFYPGDNTPVCTKQLCNYRDNLDDFDQLGVRVLAINPQKLRSHEKFAGKHDFPFPLVSDAGGTVCSAYGARNFLGQAKRALFLVDTDLTVQYRHIDFPVFHRSADELRGVIEELELG